MRKLKVFLINGVILTFTALLLQTVGLVFNVYISNKIGAESLGVFNLMMSVYFFFYAFAVSGINLASMRLISEELANGYGGNVKKCMKYCVLYGLIFGVSACILFICLSSVISKYWLHGKVSKLPLFITSLSLPFVSMSCALKGYFSAVRRVSKTAFTEVFEQLIKCSLIIFFINKLSYINIDLACISLVLGDTIAEVFSFSMLFLLYIVDRNKYKFSKTKNSKFLKNLLRISLPISFTTYIKSGLSTMQQILIPFRLEKTGISCEIALSQYGQVSGMVMPIIMFPSIFITSFANLLVPEFSEYNVKNKTFQINYNISKIIKYTLYFSTCVFGVFLCFNKELCTLIYNLPEISKYLLILSPTIILIYLDRVIDSILKGLDKQVKVMGINIIDLFTSISFIYFLLPIWGINGYLFVILFSEFINFSLSLRILIKETHFKFDFINIIKPLICLILSVFILFFIKGFFEISIINLCLLILGFVLIYLCILRYFEKKIL